VDVDVETNFAAHWMLLLKNTGANPLTALSVARVPIGDLAENAVAVTTGIPLAGGATLTAIDGKQEPVLRVRLTLTSLLGTTVKINAAGD
jgi:hypothetical protein